MQLSNIYRTIIETIQSNQTLENPCLGRASSNHQYIL